MLHFVKALLITVLVSLLAGIGITVAAQRGLFAETPLASLSQFDPKNITAVLNNGQAQTQTLVTRSTEVATQASDVLGTFIERNESAASEGQSPTEKAAEYAQYLYCKQVVEGWDKSNSDQP